MKRLLMGTALAGALGCGPILCVARGAKIRTPRGLRFIEDIAEGDDVLCADPEKGQLVAAKVTVVRGSRRECVTLGLGDIELTVTSDHPLYCPRTKEWAPAGDWALGKRTHLLRISDERFAVVAVEQTLTYAGVHDVFDLTVDHPLHNFIANEVLVHNKSPPLTTCTLPGGSQTVLENDSCQCPGGDQGVVQCTRDAGTGTCTRCANVGNGQDAGRDAGTDAGMDGGQLACPRVVLGSTLPAEYSGDTTLLPNIVTSSRLEWTDAPDDALEFTAPVDGDYVIELTSGVPALGASAQDYNTNGSDAFPFNRTACPAPGAVKEINGVYNDNQPNYPIRLSAGQSMVIFVSAPYWANMKSGAYTLKVRKVP